MTPRFPREFRPTVLKTSLRSSLCTCTGLSPSMVRRSRRLSLNIEDHNSELTTPHLPCGIQFELRRVRSPLLTTSRLISSPAPTKMFQFGAFPFRWRNDAHASGCPIRGSPVQWLHAPTRSLSQLGTPFFSTRTEPSTDRRKNV